ncbi:MAG: hypothetical protein JST59_02240 [Actinobacteria bacterium]|nr:hypothetical protein [Actinomycetota bacterium]
MEDKIKELAKKLYQEKSILIMARGYQYATALEAALVLFVLNIYLPCLENQGDLLHSL